MNKPKSSLQLYRDCLRLIKHMAGTSSPKATQLKAIVAERFRANKHVTDTATLHALKQSAERGLSNYLLFERAKLDPKIAAAAADLDKFEDDEKGNLVRVVKKEMPVAPGSAPSAAAAAAAAAAVVAQAAAKKARSIKPGGISSASGAAKKKAE